MRYLFCLLVLMVTLSACGIKGALYLPEQRYPQKNVPAATSNDASSATPSPMPSNIQPINSTKETK